MKSNPPTIQMQTNQATSILLAVNPGSRYLGLALFEGARLIEWRIRVIKGVDSDARKARVATIIETLVRQYRPSIMVLKKVHPRRSSVLLDQLTLEITRLGLKQGLRVHSFTTAAVARLLSPQAHASRQARARYIVTEHPMLQRELNRELASRHAYHSRMFEAVALGMAARRYLGRI